jgi:fucose permease
MNTTNQSTVVSAAKPAKIPAKQGMFVTADGKNVLFTFIIVSSLFLLWGFCNGMIDVMDKMFQEKLHLSLSQSAWVQFAHYLGYFLMSLPAGWLATRLGYKGGIIAGLLMVAVGGFWFIPATHIAAFWAFLVGVCVIASGLTFLETVANPYTTVLGPSRYAATRINTAQSCNGVGWILGPIAGGMFFYAKDASGHSTGAETLWIPYAGVAVVVLILAAIFYFAPVPDIAAEDDYNIADKDNDNGAAAARPVREVHFGRAYTLLLANAAALISVFGMILWLILDTLGFGSRLVGLASAIARPAGLAVNQDNSVVIVLIAVGLLAVVIAAFVLTKTVKRLTHHSVWAHEHFSGATLAQFLYVAAQAGIFSFLINYMTSEPPSLPSSWLTQSTSKWFEVRTAFAGSDFTDVRSLTVRLSEKADPLSAFLATNLSASTLQTLDRYKQGTATATAARVAVMQDLNSLILETNLYTPARFSGVTLQEKTKQLLLPDSPQRNRARINRLLLSDAYPKELAFHDGVLSVSNQGAANLASFGFICFLLGRISGAALLRRFSAHKIVALYGVLNVLMCLLVFLKLGWLSVASVFLSYFFMSIMFPTIFALGIFGLGVRAKGASAYIVMGIMGGAILPKVMGAVADHYDMSRGFIVPMICFVFIALYGYCWPKLSRVESLHGVGTSGAH